jgi:acetyl esterase/lipase
MRISLLLLCLLLGACQAGFMRSLKLPYALSAYQKSSLSYGADAMQRIDIYRPTSQRFDGQKLPVVVFYFGGSWRSGKPAWYEFFAARLALQGYLVMVPDYRKAPNFIFPSFMEDAARALRFSQAQAPQFGGDAQQLFVMGHSAGAHMAALLCLDARYLATQDMRPADINGFIGLSGPYDFLPMTDPLVVEVFQGDANLPASQPINFAQFGAAAPPMLLIHGETDALVYPKNSVNLAAAVNAVGGRAEVAVMPKIGHAKPLFQAARGLRWLAPEVDPLVLGFLAQHRN